MNDIVKVKNLRKVYPGPKRGAAEVVAVEDASFSIREGEILGLLGPNGAGKSTIISMLLGVLTPTSGTVNVFGSDLHTHHSEIMQHVTFASTYVRMPWRLTVIENLRVFGLLYGQSKAEFMERAQELLTFFGVWNQRNKTMSQLSAGQVTRVMLAKAFIPDPKIVLLDEPTASLDPDIAHQVRTFVLGQQKKHKTTILYTSHNMDEVTEVCDRVIFLRQGKIMAEDTPENLANSISDTEMVLTVANTEERKSLIALAQKGGYKTQATGKDVLIQIEEIHISELLTTVGKQKIHYSHITVQQPTLEQYFLQMSNQKHEN